MKARIHRFKGRKNIDTPTFFSSLNKRRPKNFVEQAIREAVIQFRELAKKGKEERRNELSRLIILTKEQSDKNYGTDLGFRNAIKHTIFMNILSWAENPEKMKPDERMLIWLRTQMIKIRPRLSGAGLDLQTEEFMALVKKALDEIK